MAYVRELTTDPSWGHMIFTGESGLIVDFLESGWWAEGAEPAARARAPEALVARMMEEGGLPAIRYCPSLRHFLSARGHAYGRQAARDYAGAPRRVQYRSGIVYLTLPMVSEDGRRAVFQFSHSGAGASARLAERQADGHWRVVASQPLAVY